MITRHAPRGSSRSIAPTAVAYFTDDLDLYRVVRWLRRPSEPALAEVENCRTLACELVSPEDLNRLCVRVISTTENAGPRRGNAIPPEDL
jgi:hypothetical protein